MDRTGYHSIVRCRKSLKVYVRPKNETKRSVRILLIRYCSIKYSLTLLFIGVNYITLRVNKMDPSWKRRVHNNHATCYYGVTMKFSFTPQLEQIFLPVIGSVSLKLCVFVNTTTLTSLSAIVKHFSVSHLNCIHGFL